MSEGVNRFPHLLTPGCHNVTTIASIEIVCCRPKSLNVSALNFAHRRGTTRTDSRRASLGRGGNARFHTASAHCRQCFSDQMGAQVWGFLVGENAKSCSATVTESEIQRLHCFVSYDFDHGARPAMMSAQARPRSISLFGSLPAGRSLVGVTPLNTG